MILKFESTIMGRVTIMLLRACSQILNSQRRLWLTAFLVVGASSAGIEAVPGQAGWPVRPISLLVPYPAGSAADTLARTLSGPLREKTGQPFIIENRPGADGMIAGRAVARSEPNGYTQYFGVTTSLSLAFNLQPNLGFDPRKDYAPVSMVGQTAYLLVVNSALGVNSVPDLVALARSKPGALNYSSTGEGSIAHLGMLVLAKKLGIEMTHIPYKTTAQSIMDVASGVIQLQLATVSPTLPLYQAGKIRILGVASDRRTPLLPDVPTLQEEGVPDFQAKFSMALFLPAGSPEIIVTRLSQAVDETLADATVQKAYFEQGFEPKASSPAELGQYIATEIETYRQIVAEYGIRTQ
jgi:tripartite-type tricarboxylate transporter receptor subunit TctC